MTEDEIKKGFDFLEGLLDGERKRLEQELASLDPYTRGMALIKKITQQCEEIDEIRNSV